MNTYKKIIASILLISFAQTFEAAVPCGTSAPGVLNVGFLPGNLPWGDWDPTTGQAIGFDPDLITAVAKLLGYDMVNFVGFGDDFAGEEALLAGTIDIYADSSLVLPISPFIGVVTDVSGVSLGTSNGWLVNPACCTLAQLLDAAITKVVNTGIYAQILQSLRANGQTGGYNLGFPKTAASGVLEEPFPYASNELGTIPTICAGPIGLPQTNCIGSYLQSVCTPTTTFTGATGQIPS